MSFYSLDLLHHEMETYPAVTPELLDDVVARILSVGAPLKVVLFGSRARGDYKPDSDLDILIIEEKSEQCKAKERQYNDALTGVYPEYTLIVRPLREVEEWKYVPNQLVTEALAQGKVLYEDKPRLARLLTVTRETLHVAEEPMKNSG